MSKGVKIACEERPGVCAANLAPGRGAKFRAQPAGRPGVHCTALHCTALRRVPAASVLRKIPPYTEAQSRLISLDIKSRMSFSLIELHKNTRSTFFGKRFIIIIFNGNLPYTWPRFE